MNKICIRGFYHRDNIGDDGVYKIISRELKDYSPTFSWDEFPTHERFDVTIVGGGGLSPWMTKGVVTKRLYGFSVGLVQEVSGGSILYNQMRDQVRTFDHIFVRDKLSYTVGRAITDKITLMADASMLLNPIYPKQPFNNKIGISPRYDFGDVTSYLNNLDNKIFMPFLGIDAEWAHKEFPQVNMFYDKDPEKILGALKGLKHFYCWHQLHPLVYCAMMKVPSTVTNGIAKTLAFRNMQENYTIDEMRHMAREGMDKLLELL